MNFVFIGASRFGLRCLELAKNISGCHLTGVVTAAERFPISYRPQGVTNVLYADLASFAAGHGLPCRTIASGMNDPVLFDEVKGWRPDAFLVAGWYHMVPKSWRELAPAYGLHASLLPDYSGGAPLVWAIINGEKQTGITLFQMDDGVDSGPIVAQEEEPIFEDDTITTLYARIEERGLALLNTALPKLVSGAAELRAQPKEGRRVMPQRSPEDGKIDWNTDSKFIERFVRAQTRPYPGAFFVLNGRRITIWAARAREDYPTVPAGSIRIENEEVLISCNVGELQLNEIEMNGYRYAGQEIQKAVEDGIFLAGDKGET
jgi:methionyl-tRNA formyltransferase